MLVLALVVTVDVVLFLDWCISSIPHLFCALVEQVVIGTSGFRTFQLIGRSTCFGVRHERQERQVHGAVARQKIPPPAFVGPTRQMAALGCRLDMSFLLRRVGELLFGEIDRRQHDLSPNHTLSCSAGILAVRCTPISVAMVLSRRGRLCSHLVGLRARRRYNSSHSRSQENSNGRAIFMGLPGQ